MTITTVLIFLIVLAILIFVHELGHFLAAKSFGIRVDAFAIGFGPRIFSWKKGETEYSIRIIPFGGYVKIFGENPDEESLSGPDSKRSIVNKPRWQQAIVLVAGITFNFIFAGLLYIVIFAVGITATTDGFEQYTNYFSNPRIMITEIMPYSPADEAGIKIGDVINRFDGNIAKSTENIQGYISSKENIPIKFDILRNKQNLSIEIIPKSGFIEGKAAVGIAMQDVADLKLPFFMAIYEGLHYTIIMMRDTVVGLYSFFASLFHGNANFSDMAGPVGIAGIIGNAAELGLAYLMMIMAIISINLGIINLIPFPALDGGRILFVAIEGVIRRRIPAKFSNIVNTFGFVFLMAIMVLVTYKDIVRLIK
jgi:regulator of sigma E protease